MGRINAPCRSHGHRLHVSMLVLALLTAAPARPTATTHTPVLQPTAAESQARVRETYGKLPLYFEANLGQSDPQVKFLARAPHQTLFLTSTEAVLSLTKRESTTLPAHGNSEPSGSAHGAVLRMTFAGANPTPRLSGFEEQPGKANYFFGNDPAKWRTEVSTYAKVRYDDLYPGVDLIYYGTQRQLEYDLIVHAGTDPTRVALAFKGSDRQEVDAQGDLVLYTTAGPIRQRKPVIYQEMNGVRQEIPGGYVLTARHQVTFRVGAYDIRRPLVIDPVLVYSTYLGGSGADEGAGIAVDGHGNAYVTGFTASTNFPTSSGALEASYGGGLIDACVTKLDPTGSALVYSTYLGGSDLDEAFGIAVDGLGNAYMTGATFSNNFPTTEGAFQTTYGGGFGDGFVTKLSPTGSALVYSTYLGGSGQDGGNGIAVDAAGDVHVTGLTSSWYDFPTTAGAFQTTFGNGYQKAFVTKLDPTGSTLVYSTYLGGSDISDFDQGEGIALDTLGNAYATGFTHSADFPTTAGASQTRLAGIDNAFVTKLSFSGSALYSTFLGGGNIDHGSGIATDAEGNAYVTGFTDSTDFPTTTGAFQTTFHGVVDAFVTKLNPTGSSIVYSTYLGGTDDDGGGAIAVDTAGNAYVMGSTQSTDFPTTAGALQTTFGGVYDTFVTKLDFTGSVPLVYSTYLGGSGGDGGVGLGLDAPGGIAVDPLGNAYVSGTTRSTDFPTTARAFQVTSGGNYDVFVAKIATPVSPPPPTTVGMVTGGGNINVPGGIANFGFMVQARSATGPIVGNLQFVDQTSGANVHGVTFDSFVVAGTTATFGGSCMNNGVPCRFTVQVQDNGEPGANDTFSIAIDAGSPEGANESLRSGDVVIHQDAGRSARKRGTTGTRATPTHGGVGR